MTARPAAVVLLLTTLATVATLDATHLRAPRCLDRPVDPPVTRVAAPRELTLYRLDVRYVDASRTSQDVC